VLDDLSTGSLDNLEGFYVDFRKGHTKDVAKIVPEKVDLIFHLGIASTTTLYLGDRNLVAKEIEGSVAIYEKAAANKAKIVLASSSSLYNGGDMPSKENQHIRITDFYTECRYAIERLGKLYVDLYGISVVALRMFSVYGGERERAKKGYANMITKFIWRIENGLSPISYGDGTQTRDFTYIEDIVDAWILASEYNCKYQVFNIGTGISYTFNEVGEIVNNIIGTRYPMEYEGNPLPNFVYYTLADTTKAEQKLKFKAKYSLKEGIREIINGKD
jgi:UDP-glucose 4-epimerase